MPETTELKVETKESIALKLTDTIANREDLYNDKENYRKNILDLYAECLEATSNQRNYPESQ